MIDRSLRPALSGPLAVAVSMSALLALSGCATAPEVPAGPEPPSTRVDEVVDTVHGVAITDPYRWLEDQESPETRVWIDAQNQYTDAVLDDLPGRDGMRERFAALLQIDEVGFPVAAGSRTFFSTRRADQDLRVISMRERGQDETETLIDPHGLDADHAKSVVLLDVSQDGGLLAYGIRHGGRDELLIHLYDVDTRSDLGAELPDGRYSGLSITPDKTTLFYSRVTPAGPRVFEHRIGTDAAEDRVIFGEGRGVEQILGVELSEDGRHLLVHVYHGAAGERTDVFLADRENGGAFVAVVEGLEATFEATFAGSELVVRTTLEAPQGRIMRAALARPERAHWREIVPMRDSAVLRSVSAVGGKLYANYLENVQSRVVAYDLEGAEVGGIELETIGSVSTVSGRWGETEAYYGFSSFYVPQTVYRYDTATGERAVWSRPDIAIDADAFEVEQVRFTSRDGTQVPMFVVRRADAARDGARPTLLTGYGGFNVSLTPRWSAAAVTWVERGGVYAVANLRGGGELGEAWHQAGMRERKQNVFDDFIAAAEYLIDDGWTRPDKLAIRGGSNGGLLVGAVANQRPDLFAAVVCSYPLLDMVRYHQFMVARYWVPEYGSSESPEQFPVLHAYSPYHNVVDGGRYPAMLFITGDGDTRVAPLHARKMAALVQAKNASDRPILLRYHIKAGHSGGKPVSREIDDSVETFAFLLAELGELTT